MIIVALTIIFLFTLYMLSKDDFVLMRRNVSQKTVFDIACICGVVGLFFARIVYVAMHPSTAYFNPLVFLIIPYFPGLSAAGFLFGMCLSLYIFTVRKKLPIGKLFDIFSLSLIASGEMYFLIQAIMELVHKHFLFSGVYAASFIVLFCIYMFSRRLTVVNRIKDGSAAFLGLVSLFLVIALSQLGIGLFRSIPKELPYFIAILFILLVSFIVRMMRKQGAGRE